MTGGDAGEAPVAIICGGGSLPAAVAQSLERRGRAVVLFPIDGWADAKMVAPYRHHWIAIGQVGRFLRLAAAERCRDLVFIGTLLRPTLRQIRLDWRTVRLMPKIIPLFRGGDDRLLGGLGGLLEEFGFRLLAVPDVAPEVAMPMGPLGQRKPAARDGEDIALGVALLNAIAPYDIGQAVVVSDRRVLAIEAAEGTDEMLARIVELRRLGRLRSPVGRGVLVKAVKPGQDRRFDLPTIGPNTVAGVARAGLAGLAVVAGDALVAEPHHVGAAADRARLFVVGVEGRS